MTGQILLPHLDSNQKPFDLCLRFVQYMSTSFVPTKTTESVHLKKINSAGVSRGVNAL